MPDYVSPQVAEAAKSTRSEAEVRELAKAKIAAERALSEHFKKDRSAMTDDELIEFEVEAVRLARASNAAHMALLGAV